MKNIEDWPAIDKGKLLAYLGCNSYCSEYNKLLYVATPKVACTSLKWWFADYVGLIQFFLSFVLALGKAKIIGFGSYLGQKKIFKALSRLS